MRQVWLLAIALLAAGFLLYTYGGRLLTSRHRVAEFRWKLPPGRPAVLADGLAWEGIELALRANSEDATAWKPVPEDTTGILRKGRDTNTGLVILSNSTSVARLFARVELDVSNRALNIIISRPK